MSRPERRRSVEATKEVVMFETIVWASDGSAAADRALDYAKILAHAGGGRLVAVHCREIFAGRGGGYPVLADDDELVEKIEEQAKEAEREGLTVSLRVINTGSAATAQVIADAAKEAGADVIVVGTRGHGPFTGLIVGSVTQRLLHDARCPVLAVPGKEAPDASARVPRARTAVLGRDS
jgi:nucleotide-binding universal stress UspA family protein